MKVTNKITIHLDDPQVQRPVNVMQCDVNTRELEIALFAGGKKWEIPDGVTPVISYRKPDGTGGLYDTLPDGAPACRMDKNMVWAILPPPALEVPGMVDLAVIFADNNGDQLAAFGAPIDVHRNPGVGAVASGDYFNLQKWVKETAIAAVPKALPNPQKLILTGAVEVEYDGSENVKVIIPSGSGVHIGPDRPLNGEAIWIKTDEQDEEAAPEVHIGSEPPTNGEAIWINPDEEPEGNAGTVSPEAIKQAVDEYMAENPVKETDPTIPAWAKQPEKPKYTAEEVGALPADTPIPEGVTDEQIKNAVDAYLAENPVDVGDCIAPPATASVGQTIVVKAVDESGKPTEWEAADLPSGGGGSGGSIWLQPFELMGTATLQEDCERWVITQTDDGTTFAYKQYRAIRFNTKTVASADTTANNADGKVWINYAGGGQELAGSNMVHSGAIRSQHFYGETANGKSYLKQLGSAQEKLNSAAKTYTTQIIVNVGTSGHKLGAGSTVEIWGCK